jgi:diaminobutyrate-2-oxoglutarate transaminase
LREQLQGLQSRYPQLGDVRGRGLMVGVELVEPLGQPDAQGHRPANRLLAPKLQRECLKRGLILELGGRHGAVVRFLPPLIISAQQVDEVVQRFAQALAAAV